jgi:hypothetical protein
VVVVINTETWDVTKRSRGEFWYSYNNLEAPIKYSIYQKQPETPLVLNQPYTEFLKEKGDTFTDDQELIDYLDDVFNVPPNDVDLEFSSSGGDNSLKVNDQLSNELLRGVLLEMKKINKHLYFITENDLTKDK